MKHYIIIAALAAVTLTACNSKERNAANTIKEEMRQTLNDFKSYEAVETTFEPLLDNAYGDTAVYDALQTITTIEPSLESLARTYEQAKEYGLGNPDTEKRIAEGRAKINACYDVIAERYAADGEQYGWRVTHKYRANNKLGGSILATQTYFMDMDCKHIFRTVPDDYDYQILTAVANAENREK